MASTGALPTLGNLDGDVRIETTGYTCWVWDAGISSWAQLAGSPAGNGFGIMQPPFGGSVTASTLDDTCNWTSSDSSVVITGTTATKTMDLKATGKVSVSGSSATPVVVTAAGGIVIPSPGAPRSVLYMKSNTGAFSITANPQITPPTVDGSELDVMGTDANISISDGTGFLLNGPLTSAPGSMWTFVADLSAGVWRYKTRNGI